MTFEDGVYTIPCYINGVPMKFVFDTGASAVSISMTEANYMYEKGYINENDIRGLTTSQIANGEIEVNMEINLREVKIGSKILYNVQAIVSSSDYAPLLLGQSVIRKLGNWSIENDFLVLKSDQNDPKQKLMQAAEQGDANAQINLGIYYFKNNDFKQALYWYNKAAAQGNILAYLNLGGYYESKTNQSNEAMYWYKKAADKGSNIGREKLRILYENIGMTKGPYPHRVSNKFGEEQYKLGVSYQNGEGSPQSYQQAAYWFKIAAEKGNDKAQYILGDYYYCGKGVAQSYQMAANWWKRAAEKGNADAQYKYGECFFNGEGVEQSYLTAIKWYYEAAKLGQSMAKNTLLKFFLISISLLIIVIFIFRKW